MARTFTAQYKGICARCNEVIDVGQAITWARRGAKGVFHASCESMPVQVQVRETPEPKPFEMPMPETLTAEPVKVPESPRPIGALFPPSMLQSEPAPAKDSPMTRSESAPAPHIVSSDLSNPAAMLAAMIEPYIVAKVDGLEERIQQATDSAVARAMALVPTKRIEIFNTRTGETKTVEGQHELFSLLLSLCGIVDPFPTCTYLWGDAGSGKSTAARVIAKSLGLNFGYLACNNQTPEYRLTGFIDAKGDYVETDFYRCYVNGGVFLLDEADAANGNLMCSLNGALANGHASFPIGTITRHSDFICIATGNTNGNGPTPAFPDRRPLDGAFKDRFAFVEWNTDVELETSAAIAKNPVNGATWAGWVRKVRAYSKTSVPKLLVTQRASIEGAKLLRILPPSKVAHMVIFKGIDPDSVSKILSNCPIPAVS